MAHKTDAAVVGAATEPPVRAIPDVVARGDIRETGWWVMRSVIDGSLDTREAGVLSTVLRVLLVAGEGGLDDESALREVELRGLLMHGVPPREAEEWALMRERFSPEAVAEAERWSALFESDALDGVNPGVFRER